MGLLRKLKKGCKSICGTITGKKKAKQAKEKLEALQRDFEERNNQYKDFVEFKASEITKQIQDINELKIKTFSSGFPGFLEVANTLHNVRVRGKPILDAVSIPKEMLHTPEAVRCNAEVLAIDFDNLSTKEKIVGVMSLGFSTRKAAKESLKRAEDEEQRLEEEYVKMNATKLKLEHTLKALEEIAHYYRSILVIYERTCKRLAHGIAAQKVAHIAFSGQFAGKVDFRSLPVNQLEDFMALYNLTILLKEMASRHYVSVPTEGDVNLEIEKKDQELIQLAKSNGEQLGMVA